jgi:integrase
VKATRKPRSAFDVLLSDQEPLYDEQRLPVTMIGYRWRLNSVMRGSGATLNWEACRAVSPDVAAAIVAFVRFNVERKSPDHCRNLFRDLTMLTHLYERLGDVPLRTLLYGYLAQLRGAGAEWRFHYVRDWYRWCSDNDLPGFDDPDLYYEITSLRVPGNRKGDAVRSQDPDEGPLDEVEEATLRAALLRDDGPIIERAITWTLLALGCNPANLVYLCEEDFKTVRSGANVFYSLDVPRIKKRQPPRAEFKTRKLDSALASLFELMCRRNQDIGIPNSHSRPLFARMTRRDDCIGTAIESFAFHHTSEDIKTLLRQCVRRLGIVSHRTGKPLQVSPRRLRYTFATRKVQEGCSMDALAELLDHTDLQHVIVYYSGRGIVKRLDEAIAVSIGPLVNRFMGRVVADESQAVDGGGRIKAEPLGRIVDIGTCGSASLCTLFPPASCYLCPQFQPWKNAPHRDVLDDLLRRRDERVSAVGRPEDRIAKQYDEMILAVGQVVAICEDRV